jgi:hypothetical protein
LPATDRLYAYTIFSSAGNNIPDTFINLSGNNAAISFKISDIWDGFLGGGDNDSGLEGLASEERATVLRAMIRDANGNWFASDLFCPSTLEDSSVSNGAVLEYTYPLSDTNWYAYPQAETENLNALVGNDEIPLTRDPADGTPDLTKVTGMGVFVWNAFDTSNGQLAFTEISLTGESVDVPNYELSQDFSVPGDTFNRLDENGLGETPKAPDFDLTPTGWSWGGYASETSYRVEIDQNTRGDVVFDELIFKPRATEPEIVNSYAYTIFDSSGGNQPDRFIDLSRAGSAITLYISDIWDGWFGGGDNGSGLPEPQNEVRATVLRAMIRDANGKWFATDLFCPSVYESTTTTGLPKLDGTIVDYKYTLNASTWYEYSQAENDNLNALAPDDEIALTRDPAPAATAPDLTMVSGMGIFVWHAYNTTNGQLAFTEVVLTGEEVIVPDYWDNDDLMAMADEWLRDEIIWEENMDTDPVAGGNWVLRDGIPGDYIIAGGEMLIQGNSSGNWRLDTMPPANFLSPHTSCISAKATTATDDTTGSRSGINYWITADIDPDQGALSTNCGIVLEMDGTQYVEFISEWTPGTAWPPAAYTRIEGDGTTDFDNSTLEIDVTIEADSGSATQGTLSYVISDESGTTATGSFTINRRESTIQPGSNTIYTGGAEGVVDYVYSQSGYIAANDQTGDGFVNFDDFAWLAARWLTLK